MLQTSARLLRLLTLLQSRRSWSGSDLAAELEVTERTLRRDVDRLRSLGYPVQSTSGTAGGYVLGAGASLPPLLLDDDEAIAVSIGLRAATSSGVAGIEGAAVRAQTKLERMLPERLRKRVQALHASITPLSHHALSSQSAAEIDGQLLSAIASAIRERERLVFEYGDKTRTRREVEPCGLVHTGRRWYLVAWDLGREDFRTFRVDRVVPPVVSGVRFTPRPPPDGDLRAYVSRSISVAPYPQRARVILAAPFEQIAERVYPSMGLLAPVDATSCVLETGAGSLHSLAAWIAGLGVDFTIVDPPELLARVRELADRFGRAARA